MSSDRFRPRLPLDPFAGLDAHRPWQIPPSLPHSASKVILVLGEPAPADLLPLVTSPHLARCLLVVATHRPPPIPPLSTATPGPAIRVLRLSEPLAAHDAGALRLVSIFERAQSVARIWRHSSANYPRVIQLSEHIPNGDFTVVEPFVFSDTYQSPQTLSISTTHTAQRPRYPSPAPSIASSAASSSLRLGSTPSSSTSSLSLSPAEQKRTQATIRKLSKDPFVTPTTRSFDAILNYLPSRLPDKALLKHTILVTTVSAPYLAHPTNTFNDSIGGGLLPSYHRSASSTIAVPPAATDRSKTKRFSALSFASAVDDEQLQRKGSFRRLSSLFTGASSSSPALTTVEQDVTHPSFEHPSPVKNAHLVHILPVGWVPMEYYDQQQVQHRRTEEKPKLVQSIEQFLLGFAYPLGSISSNSNKRLSMTIPHSASIPAPPSSWQATKDESPSKRYSQTPVASTSDSEGYSTGPGNSGEMKVKAKRRSSASLRPAHSQPLGLGTGMLGDALAAPEKAVPYLVAPGVFGSGVRGTKGASNSLIVPMDLVEEEGSSSGSGKGKGKETELTVGEIVLLGALDFDPLSDGGGAGGPGRAWIGDVGDVVVVGTQGQVRSRTNSTTSPAPPPRAMPTPVSAPSPLSLSPPEKTKPRKRFVPISALPTPPESASSEEGGDVGDEESSGIPHVLVEAPSPVSPNIERGGSPTPTRATSTRNTHTRKTSVQSEESSSTKRPSSDTVHVSTAPRRPPAAVVPATSPTNVIPVPLSADAAMRHSRDMGKDKTPPRPRRESTPSSSTGHKLLKKASASPQQHPGQSQPHYQTHSQHIQQQQQQQQSEKPSPKRSRSYTSPTARKLFGGSGHGHGHGHELEHGPEPVPAMPTSPHVTTPKAAYVASMDSTDIPISSGHGAPLAMSPTARPRKLVAAYEKEKERPRSIGFGLGSAIKRWSVWSSGSASGHGGKDAGVAV